MELTLDKFGRILLPKNIRDELGLHPGSSLEVKRNKDGIQLCPIEGTQATVKKGNILVFVGKLSGDVDETLKQVREERDRRNLGLDEEGH